MVGQSELTAQGNGALHVRVQTPAAQSLAVLQAGVPGSEMQTVADPQPVGLQSASAVHAVPPLLAVSECGSCQTNAEVRAW